MGSVLDGADVSQKCPGFFEKYPDFSENVPYSKRVQATKKRANTKVKARMQKKEKFSKIPKSFSPNVPFFSKCFICFSICSIVFERAPRKYQTFSNPEIFKKKSNILKKSWASPGEARKKTN